MCAAKGYRIVVTMSEGNSLERRRIIKALEAELVLVPQVHGSVPGKVSYEDLEKVEKKTEKLTQELEVFRVDQFYSESNPRGHERAGHEIWKQCGERVDAYVAFVGSSGCFTGVSRALKSHNENVKCFAVEPATAPFLAGGQVVNTSHKIPGGGYSQPLALFDRKVCDGFVCITDDEAIETVRELARYEGLIVGFSSGANVAAAMKLPKMAKQTNQDIETVATTLCDSGLRYLSTDLYD